MPYADSPAKDVATDYFLNLKVRGATSSKPDNVPNIKLSKPSDVKSQISKQFYDSIENSNNDLSGSKLAGITYDEKTMPQHMDQRTFDNRSMLYKKLSKDGSGVYITNLPLGARSMLFKNYQLDLNKEDKEHTFEKWNELNMSG